MEMRLDDTVEEEIGIATDGTGKVCIVRECETEVSLRAISVDRLRHLREEES